MRVKVKGHSNFRAIYDYIQVIEAASIRKEIQSDTCWLRIDSLAFKIPESKADELVEVAYEKGILDLTDYETSQIPW